jgi:hypothetical protein
MCMVKSVLQLISCECVFVIDLEKVIELCNVILERNKMDWKKELK